MGVVRMAWNPISSHPAESRSPFAARAIKGVRVARLRCLPVGSALIRLVKEAKQNFFAQFVLVFSYFLSMTITL